MGKEIKPIYAPERKGEIIRSFADISCAKQVLGFEPVFSMEKGLLATIEHFQNID